MSSDDGTSATSGAFTAVGAVAGAPSPAGSPSPRVPDVSARPGIALASVASSCGSGAGAGASIVCFSATTSAPDAGRSVSTATDAADVDSGAISVPDPSLVEGRSEADKSGSAAFATGAATGAAAATRLDFRLKKHTCVTLRSRACSSVSKRRPRGDQIRCSTRNLPSAPGSTSPSPSSTLSWPLPTGQAPRGTRPFHVKRSHSESVALPGQGWLPGPDRMARSRPFHVKRNPAPRTKQIQSAAVDLSTSPQRRPDVGRASAGRRPDVGRTIASAIGRADAGLANRTRYGRSDMSRYIGAPHILDTPRHV
ncbi:hypothetical protein C8K30_103213 [Promicromonospora sp. AC04]|nr:hypothetical protein C8K30_103213 [Promicromonospora sp. AC04]